MCFFIILFTCIVSVGYFHLIFGVFIKTEAMVTECFSFPSPFISSLLCTELLYVSIYICMFSFFVKIKK
uniref:Uncharacterized protein n=1 Tax=Anguilla anguilla TaxID=7936 RepID=A0A0E9WT72_ANGAN